MVNFRQCLACFLACGLAYAQPPAFAGPQGQGGGNQSGPPTGALRPNYVLGPGDQIVIRAFEMEEISEKPYLVDGDGTINLPQLGRLPVGGLTVDKIEALLIQKLKSFVQVPRVTVTVVQYRSEPVFFVGAFQRPGIYPLQGGRTLVEMISSVGGLQSNASRRIKLTRRKEFGALQLPNAVESSDGKVTTAEISMGSLRENVNPAEDVILQPFDVVSVEQAEMVYLQGEVKRIGGFPLADRESISIVQIISLAGGLTPEAKPSKARILRPVLNSSRRAEVPIDIKRILRGKDSDFPLLPNDLLYIPSASGFKKGLGKGSIVAVSMASSLIFLLVRINRTNTTSTPTTTTPTGQ